ncbi:hypothetical protein [Armatimonas sp.]|uniref:hypothetical protein n=1 Tax=Armatimonas sp. TaxID=1872638 RepID=UPI003753081A
MNDNAATLNFSAPLNMEATSRITIAITFMDGSQVAFVGNEDSNAFLTSDHRLLETRTSTVLMLEVEGSLVIYPWTSIRSVEINPCPSNNSSHVQSGLRRASSHAK